MNVMPYEKLMKFIIPLAIVTEGNFKFWDFARLQAGLNKVNFVWVNLIYVWYLNVCVT